MTRSANAVSIIVPTYQEAANIKPLVTRIFAAARLADLDAEVIFVDDDSRDGTEQMVRELASEFDVRVLVRRGQRGLSSAVLAGLGQARHDRLVVLDADLQHPPELIPAMLARLDEGCDFVIASRYMPGAAIERHWPLGRRIASRLATLLARPLAPLSDPMSGFFALPRDVLQRAERLNPMGYKIALELFVKARCTRYGEVPVSFAARHAGKSKLTASVNTAFLFHLVSLYWYRRPVLMVLVALAGASIAIGLAGWLL